MGPGGPRRGAEPWGRHLAASLGVAGDGGLYSSLALTCEAPGPASARSLLLVLRAAHPANTGEAPLPRAAVGPRALLSHQGGRFSVARPAGSSSVPAQTCPTAFSCNTSLFRPQQSSEATALPCWSQEEAQ